MTMDYNSLNETINNIINKIIYSHNLNLDEIRYINKYSNSDYENEYLGKYYSLDTTKKLRVNNKNYNKLIINNIILTNKILKII